MGGIESKNCGGPRIPVPAHFKTSSLAQPSLPKTNGSDAHTQWSQSLQVALSRTSALLTCLSFSMFLGPCCLVGSCTLLALRPENFGSMSVTPRLGEGW